MWSYKRLVFHQGNLSSEVDFFDDAMKGKGLRKREVGLSSGFSLLSIFSSSFFFPNSMKGIDLSKHGFKRGSSIV